MVATILAQKVNTTAPGIIYTFFALVALIGLMISAKIPNVKSDETNSNDAAPTNNTPTDESAFEQETSNEKNNDGTQEPIVNPIV